MDVRTALVAFLIAVLPVAYAQPAEVELGPDNKGLSLELPESAFGREGASLSVDLDGYDVTGFSRLDGRMLEVALDIPLDAGQHAISVFLFLADGGAEVVFEAALDAPEVSQSSWKFNTLLETNYRADEDPAIDYEDVDAWSNTGSVSMAASRTSGNWSVGAGLDTVYNPDNEAAPVGESWLLPSYSLYAEWQGEGATALAEAGNIAAGGDDLLFSKFQRRGAALAASATSGRASLQAFSVSSAPRNAFDGDYISPGDANERSTGVTGKLAIVEDHLVLGGGYVDGKSRLGGAGFNDPQSTLVYGGDTWNVGLDSRWLKNSLWLHVEHAESEFDADGIGVGGPANSDDATQVSLQLSSSGALGSGPFEYWSAVLQHQRVGFDFYSIGNLSLPGNIEANKARFQGGFSSVVVELELREETSNPEDDPLQATQELQSSGLTVSWSPSTIDPESGAWKLLGIPSFSGWAWRTENEQADSDALLAGFDLDNRLDEAGVSIVFAREQFSWSVEYGTVDYTDDSESVIDNGFIVYEPYSDSTNRYLSLLASWVANDRVSFDAYLQRSELEETDFSDVYRNTSYGISGNFSIVPDKLRLYLGYNLGKDRNHFGDAQYAPEQLNSNLVNLQLNWQLTQASDRTPATSLFIKGNYGRREDPGFMLDDDFWSVFIGASLKWMGDK